MIWQIRRYVCPNAARRYSLTGASSPCWISMGDANRSSLELFFLGCVLSVAEQIERARLNADIIFSYRLDAAAYKNGDLFRRDLSVYFVRRSQELSTECSFIVICDVADCYSRISHHKLDNALRIVGCNNNTRYCILQYLQYQWGVCASVCQSVDPRLAFWPNSALNNLSHHIIQDAGAKFLRYADDFHFFCNSKKEAYELLVQLSTALDNEGLSLQRSKTRILTSSEFTQMTKGLFGEEGDLNSPIHRLMSLSLRYDPYSRHASEKYEELKREIEDIDVVGLLNEQLARTRVHVAATKKIVAALSLIDSDQLFGVLASMLTRLTSLYPIATSVLITIANVFDRLSLEEKEAICVQLRELYLSGHEVMSVPTHVAYAIRMIRETQQYSESKFLASVL